MTFKEYQEGAMRTFSGADDPLREKVLCTVCGLSGEAGEYADMVKKLFYHGHEIDGMDVLLELGDILYYLTIAAMIWGSSLEEVAEMNAEKLRRRYPYGFSSQRSIERGRNG